MSGTWTPLLPAALAVPKIGLITGGLAAYWAQFEGMRAHIESANAVVHEHLVDGGMTVVDLGVVSDTHEGAAAAARLAQESLDVVVIFVGTYMTSGQVISIARECRVPVLLLELQPSSSMDHATAQTGDFLRYAGIAGLPELVNVFDRCGVTYDLIVGHLGDDGVWNRVSIWMRAVTAMAALRRANFGLMGHLYPGMLDIQSKITSIVREFGGNVDIIELDLLRELTEQAPTEALALVRNRVFESFDVLDGISEEHLDVQVRVAAGLDALMKTRKLDGLAYFHFGRGDVYEAIASGMAIGGTFHTTDGRPIGTEFDLRAVIAMFILNQLGATTMFTELYSVNYDDGVVEVGHDGSSNLRMTTPRAVLKPLEVFHGKSGSGNAVEATARPGPVTHLAVGEMGDGSIRLVVGQGTVVPGPLMSIGNSVSRVDFGCSPEVWVERWSTSGSGHHFAMSPGHYAAEIVTLAHMLGLECRVVTP